MMFQSKLTFKSLTDISKRVRYIYGIPVLFPIGPSLTENTLANGEPVVGLRVEIVAIAVQSGKDLYCI